jgi:hypothetical protein
LKKNNSVEIEETQDNQVREEVVLEKPSEKDNKLKGDETQEEVKTITTGLVTEPGPDQSNQ